MKKGIFYAVGVGTAPGDMTLRAKAVLESADVIAVPISGAGEPSAALELVRTGADLHRAALLEIVFPMHAMADYRTRLLETDVLAPLRQRLTEGKSVAMVTIGDVSVCSTAAYVRQVLTQAGFQTKTIPGVPSFCTAAAKAGISLCAGDESFTVLPGISGEAQLSDALSRSDTLVVMKAGRALPWLIPLLKAQGLWKNAVQFSDLGTAAEYMGAPDASRAGYFTILIVRKKGL